MWLCNIIDECDDINFFASSYSEIGPFKKIGTRCNINKLGKVTGIRKLEHK